MLCSNGLERKGGGRQLELQVDLRDSFRNQETESLSLVAAALRRRLLSLRPLNETGEMYN